MTAERANQMEWCSSRRGQGKPRQTNPPHPTWKPRGKKKRPGRWKTAKQYRPHPEMCLLRTKKQGTAPAIVVVGHCFTHQPGWAVCAPALGVLTGTSQ